MRHSSESEADFKYIAKVPVGRGHYRYFYDKDAYQSYLAKSKSSDDKIGSSTVGSTSNIDTKIMEDFANKLLKAFETSDTEVSRGAQSVESFENMDKKTVSTSNEEDQALTNPKYSSFNYAYIQNCTYCTAAYDIRQRGYDVQAMGVATSDGINTQELISWYDGITADDVRKFDTASKKSSNSEDVANLIESDILEQYGEGSRGHFILWWVNDLSGHDVVWEVQNGSVVLRDCQSNATASISDYVAYTESVEYFRTDNLELNENVLKTVRNRKERS